MVFRSQGACYSVGFKSVKLGDYMSSTVYFMLPAYPTSSLLHHATLNAHHFHAAPLAPLRPHAEHILGAITPPAILFKIAAERADPG